MKKGVVMDGDYIHNVNFDDMEKVKKRMFFGKTVKYVEHYNIPASYDIETSSFRNEEGHPVAITYNHAVNIDGYVFNMRTWEEFEDFMFTLSVKAGLSVDGRRMIIYVHNLHYEFQFMKKHFYWFEVFANGSERKILKAVTSNGIEFRCSYMLSGMNLERTAKNLDKYKIEKMVGDLDYDLIRTPKTPLTNKEMGYIVNDVVIIEYFIREAIEESGNILKIPLTNTGYVREYVRNNTVKSEDKKVKRQYRELMKELKLEADEYYALRFAFQGGFTHANVEYATKTMYNVKAKDLNSSYPGRMIAYQYPMSKGEKYNVKNKKDFYEQIDQYCTLFYVRFEGLVRKSNESYLSVSKAIRQKHVVVNNGRVESAEMIETWMTDIDFRMMMMSYDIDDFKIGTMFRYKRGYLPTAFVESIIKLYEDKTVLKGIEGMEAEYNKSKGMLNSTYGMSVMDVVQEEFKWNSMDNMMVKTETKTVVEKIDKENESMNRFLYYPWGVWITAYARYDLFRAINKLGSDYIYCDTDAIVYKPSDENESMFKAESDRFERLLVKASRHHKIDYEKLSPKDKHGNRHTLGIWDDDGEYTRFKTLGAKRYMTEEDGEISITVSGVNKSYAVPYMYEKFGKDKMFEAFNENLYIPEGHSGKSTHTYIDHEVEGVVVDYKGVSYRYKELSGIHLEETSYSMSISNEYREMIEWIQSNVKTGE